MNCALVSTAYANVWQTWVGRAIQTSLYSYIRSSSFSVSVQTLISNLYIFLSLCYSCPSVAGWCLSSSCRYFVPFWDSQNILNTVRNVVLYDFGQPGTFVLSNRIGGTTVHLFKIIHNMNTFCGHSAEVMNAKPSTYRNQWAAKGYVVLVLRTVINRIRRV